MRTALVFIGGPTTGDGPPSHVLDGLAADLVIAVDSGLHLAESLGWRPDVVIGDMDSVEEARLESARIDGVEVERHDRDKDATDLELGLDRALWAGTERAIVIGGAGGRLDHLLAGILAVAAQRYAPIQIEAHLDGALVVPLRGRREFAAEPGALVTILAVHGSARVTTEGLRWPLDAEVLESGSTRGVSNEFESASAVISIDDGCVVVVLPEESS